MIRKRMSLLRWYFSQPTLLCRQLERVFTNASAFWCTARLSMLGDGGTTAAFIVEEPFGCVAMCWLVTMPMAMHSTS